MSSNLNSNFLTVQGVSLKGEYILPWSGRGTNYTDEDIETVVGVMKYSDPLTQGNNLLKFEKIFSEYHGGLDAFATEPPDPTLPVFQLPNVVVLPHTAGGTDGTSRKRAAFAAENLARFQRGEEPQALIVKLS